jgi:hypothetical protein
VCRDVAELPERPERRFVVSGRFTERAARAARSPACCHAATAWSRSPVSS